MIDVPSFQRAIAAQGFDGWLFSDFHHRDSLSEQLLGLSGNALNSRPWYYLVPAAGQPHRIVHAIEPRSLEELPGELLLYGSRAELAAILERCPKGTFAAQYSVALPVLSFLDHGTALLFQEYGFRLEPSDALVQRMIGVIDRSGIESHERSASHLREIVDLAWRRIASLIDSSRRVTEGDVQSWILDEFERRGLRTDHPPIVAAGNHSGDPHFETPGRGGAAIVPGDVVQLDMWAKERQVSSVYADISWVGVAARAAEAAVQTAFGAARDARDAAVSFIRERLDQVRPVGGLEVDEFVRSRLTTAGFARALRHRTGHGIDRELHGFGVNLDSVEFPDRRLILEGSCFSIEPGLYFDGFGVRTEINAYVAGGKLCISGGTPQSTLLTLT